MSTKTLRKRIALVAVSALTAGLVSVVAVPAANAASGDNALIVSTTASTTGAASSATGAATSIGLLYKDSSTGTAQSATLLAGGALGITVTAPATAAALVATGGAFGNVVSAVGATTTFSPTMQKVYTNGTSTGLTWTASAAGSYTIYLYTGAATYASPTAGTLVGLLNVTVTSTSVSGVFSAADSACVQQTTSAAVVPGTTQDTAGASVIANGASGFVTVDLRDGYGQPLDTGALVATATNGAYVNLAAAVTAVKGTGSTAVYGAGAPTDISAVISQPTANAPLSTVVTITYNGTVVCTKSLTIAGQTASLKVTSVKTQALSGSTGAMFKVQNFDAAGNLVIPTGTSAFSADSATLNTTVSAASITTVATMLTGNTADAYSTGTYTCGSTAGSSSLVIKYLTPAGAVVKSAPFATRCAGDADTYKATWDKSSYVQGEIATLSVQFFDAKGNKANSNTTGNTATVTAPMLTLVGSITTGALPDENGVIKLKYTVGTTTGITGGSYNALVDYPTLTAANATIQTAKYTIADASTSNAAVLKAIVSLIASINKQIALLQKALLKK